MAPGIEDYPKMPPHIIEELGKKDKKRKGGYPTLPLEEYPNYPPEDKPRQNPDEPKRGVITWKI